MKDRNRFACMIYEDIFKRLDRTFDDESLGRVLRAAINYGFTGEEPKLSSPVEEYACGELTDSFDRNKESYDQKSINGSINANILWAKNEEDLKNRLSGIENITQIEIHEAVRRFKKTSKKELSSSTK